VLRLRPLFLSLLLGAALLSLRAFADPAGSDAFVSHDGRFAALFPATPQGERSGRDTWAGRVEEGSYSVQAEALRLRVEFHDMPRIAMLMLTPSALLELAKQGVVDDMRARNVATEKIALRGHPGIALRYEPGERPGSTEQARIFLVGSRLYVTFARADEPGEPSAAVSRFLASFDAWEPGDAVASLAGSLAGGM